MKEQWNKLQQLAKEEKQKTNENTETQIKISQQETNDEFYEWCFPFKNF